MPSLAFVAALALVLPAVVAIQDTTWSSSHRAQMPLQYTVVPGDTLSELRVRFAVPDATWAGHSMTVGSKLLLPSRVTLYTVKPGQGVVHVARELCAKCSQSEAIEMAKDIIQTNKLCGRKGRFVSRWCSRPRLRPGQQLYIRGTKPGPSLEERVEDVLSGNTDTPAPGSPSTTTTTTSPSTTPSSTTPTSSGSASSDALKFFKAFLKQAGQQWPAVGSCENDVTGAFNAVKDIEKHFHVSVGDLKAATTDVATALQSTSSFLTQCVDPHIGKKYQNKTKVVEQGIWNLKKDTSFVLEGINLLQQVQQIVASMKAKNYMQAGAQFAQFTAAIPDSKNPSLHAFVAFAKKVGVDVSSAEACLKDLQSSWGSITAFRKNMALDAKKFHLAVDDLGAAATSFSTALKDCGVQSPVVQKLIKKSELLTSGVSIISKGVNAVIEGSQVIDQISDAYKACKGEQFQQCGTSVGALLLKIPDTKNKSFHVLVSILHKLGGKLGQVGACLNDGLTIWDTVETMIHHDDSGTSRKFSEAALKKILTELATILDTVGKALTDCGADSGVLGKKVTKVAVEIKTATTTLSSGARLILGGVDVYDSVVDTVQTCKKQQQHQALQCGDAIGNTLVKVSELQAPFLKLFLSFAKTLGSKILDVDKCMGDVELVKTDFEAFVQEVRSHDEHKVRQSLVKVAAVLKVFGKSLADCKILWASEKILAVVAKFESGIAEIEVGVKIAINGVDLYNDIMNTVSDYRTHDYVACGIDLGKTVLKLIDVLTL